MGRTVNSWTINDEETMKDMIRWGLDGIITDDPALASELRNE
jgi:glycerophosphoryl diester phosphodiesterase